MVKTHPDSRFALYTLDQIRDAAAIILQIDKTDSTFTDSKKTVYLCEIVPAAYYSRSSTAERLTDEICKVNAENRKLRNKIAQLEKSLKGVVKYANKNQSLGN